MNLIKEIEDVLWKRETPESAMYINREAINKLIQSGMVVSPYCKIPRSDSEIVTIVLNQLKGKEKQALNILPFKTPYDRYYPTRDWFDKNIKGVCL